MPVALFGSMVAYTSPAGSQVDARPEADVITSYSIHYTKLYDMEEYLGLYDRVLSGKRSVAQV